MRTSTGSAPYPNRKTCLVDSARITEPSGAGLRESEFRLTPFPFVVGCGRSGTTLLRAMLTSHPDLAVPAESYFIVSMNMQRRRYEHPRGFLLDLYLADLDRHGWFRQWDLPLASVAEQLRSEDPVRHLSDAFRGTYAAYAKAQGKSRYGDKTPPYVLNIPAISEVFPESRFIHLIRDGRDVAASLTKVHFGPDSIVEAALYWQAHVEAGRIAGSALASDRYLEVRYEDLVSRPRETLQALCDFIDLPFADSMLHFASTAESILAPLEFPDHVSGVLKPPTVGVRDWRLDLAPRDVALVESAAGRLLEELGYETVSDQMPDEIRTLAEATKRAAERSQAWKRRLNHPVRLFRRRIRPVVRVAQSYLPPRRHGDGF